MTLIEVKEILSAEVYAREDKLEKAVVYGCGADLMSDVLAFSKEKALLLTGLVNAQVIRTAEMMDITAVCFVRGKKPDAAMIELANEKGIVVMSTDKLMYDSCGLLYSKGLNGQR